LKKLLYNFGKMENPVEEKNQEKIEELSSESEVTTSPEIDCPDPDPEPAPKRNENVERVNSLYINIQAGQNVRGGLSFQDCRQLNNAKKTLIEYFETTDGNTKSKKEHFDAFSVMVQSVELIQGKGCYSLAGAEMLLDIIENLEKALDSNKDAALKLKEKQEKYQRKVPVKNVNKPKQQTKK
jgi:DNA-dependent RNA polymerase auxiliary subunit epsilon